MADRGLAVVELAALNDWLDAAAALELVKASKACRGAATRAAYRRAGGLLIAPNLRGVSEAARRKLDRRGLGALSRLLEGETTRIHACALERLPRADDAAVQDFVLSTLDDAQTLTVHQIPARLTMFSSEAKALESDSPNQNPSSRLLRRAATVLPRLKVLHVGCGHLSSFRLGEILRMCPRTVEHISLAGCSVDMRDEILEEVSLPVGLTLRSLNLAGLRRLTAANIYKLGFRLTSLEVLGLDGCDVALETILRIRTCFPALRTLHATRSELARHVSLDDPMRLVAALAARQLESIGVGGRLKKRTTRSAAAGPPLVVDTPRIPDRLRRLDATDAAFSFVYQLIGAGAPTLLALDLTACSDADSRRIGALVARLPQLRLLRLAAVDPPLCDAGLSFVLAELAAPQKLRLLDLSNTAVTKDGVADASRRCGPQLIVRARGVDGVTRARRPRARGGCAFDAPNGDLFKTRDAFMCASCPDAVICARCAETSRNLGHEVLFLGTMKMYCDGPTLFSDARLECA